MAHRSPSTARMLTVALLALVVTCTGVVTPAVAAPDAVAPAVEFSEAERDLATLRKNLRSSKSLDDEIIRYMNLVATAHVNMAVPEDAAAQAKFEKVLSKYRHDAELLMLKALRLKKLRKKVNLRTDVNVHAAKVIGQLADAYPGAEGAKPRAHLSNHLRNEIRGLQGAKHDVHADVLEAALASLAMLGDIKSLDWMLDEFSHTKAVEVDWLVAAHKAMVKFPVKPDESSGRAFAPGRMRQAIVNKFITIYTAVETAANTSSNDAGILAKKRLWDRMKSHTIPVLQHFAHAPRDPATGAAYATMKEFQRWFRDHRSLRRAPWRDPK